MQNSAISNFRNRIMKASDLFVAAITISVLSLTWLAGRLIDAHVRHLDTTELSRYGYLRSYFDGNAIKSYLEISASVLVVMALVYWGLRKLRAYAPACSDLSALAVFFVLVGFSVPTGAAAWMLDCFELYHLAPSRFAAFLMEVQQVVHPDPENAKLIWPLAAIKMIIAVTLPLLYISTYLKPLKPIKAVRIV
ncbi:hypothetical protein O9X98_14985 [Agrobacterium salinitolerans]|nr:hypothetical protein [Agrobacterium salinitolerans]